MLRESPVHVHVPFRKLNRYMKSVVQRRLNIELYINSLDLDNTPKEKFMEWESIFRNKDIGVTIHAPYMDISPGGTDSKIRQASLERMMQLTNIAKILNPKMIIVHPGYDHWRNFKKLNQWLENSCSFWTEILEYTKNSNFFFAVENVFEQTPETLQKLITMIASPRFGFCFDTGHFNLFSKKPLDEWLERLGPYLFETHLHDNRGDEDSHLPMGDGSFPFHHYFELLSNISNQPVLTFETHSEEGVLASMRFFSRNFLCPHPVK